MKKTLSAYRPKDKALNNMSLERFAALLWESSGGDGLLYMPEREYVTREKEVGSLFLRCQMDWNREEALLLADQVKQLARFLEKQAALERAGEEGNVLPEKCLMYSGNFRQCYFDPLLSHNRPDSELDRVVSLLIYMDQTPQAKHMQDIIRRRKMRRIRKGPAELGAVPDGMELLRFWSQSESMAAAAETRLHRKKKRDFSGLKPRSLKPFLALQHILQVKWLYRLFLFEAPKKMIRELIREMYRFTALDLYAREVVPVYLSRGLGFPLWEIREPQLVREWFEEDFRAADGMELKEWERRYDELTTLKTMQDLFFFRENHPPESFGEAEESMAEHMAACRELNPLGLPFYVWDEGLATGRALVICHEEEAAHWEGRTPREPEEIRAAVEAFAKAFGVPEELVDVYELDES